ncbi:MAG TPA: hemerythrin domain-containing protein [Azospirillum sp.]|nr:hemerythrin domain-containing protein [Azospirillum sp.]
MTTAELAQSSPARVNELFAKLADTGNGALKTRETLFTALKEELDLHAKLEQRDLFPALRNHKETRGLIPDAMDDSRRVRALLAELDRTAKDDEGFPKRLAELKTVFQRHIRDERKELLPALKKAIGDDEAGPTARKRESGKAKVEDARRRKATERRAAQRRERETAKRLEAGPKAEARRVREAGATLARSATDAVDGGLRAAGSGVRATRHAGEMAGRLAQRSSASMAGTMRGALGAMPPAIDTLQVLAALPHVTVGVMNEAARIWMEWADRTRQSASRRAEALTRCSSPREFTQAQGRFLQDAVDAWSEAGSRMALISTRAAGQLLEPVERQAERAKDAAGVTGRPRS